MMFSRDYLFELFTTHKFSDFCFTRPGERGLEVHKVLLSARSPIFKWYFETHKGKKADLLDLVACEGIMGYDSDDEANNTALRDSLFDIIAFCYLENCSDCRRDTNIHFNIRVIPLLLTHALADRFEIPDLVAGAEKKFRDAFAWFCTNAVDEHVESALKICFSPDLLKKRHIQGRTLELLRDTAMWMFEQQVENYKRAGQREKLMALMAGIPQASAKLGRQLVDADQAGTKGEAEGSVKQGTRE
ncbi:uncharacterized protein K460DRAFT_410686 [Cucurbitaria berberidis CBS 394.84]|uniref:BTB domain-containing protein n=1 Tax=Cucurbitaria berberidis CBS 394.84 TaxID=1168544 RepID=A0A9P4G6T6_9PLEO|nr:uncharacterized protein K460DRAFT_410686 [Cucurbitaria berberidis CBS 394.84]KAF1840074.1 hypothetical protein K460DRAFT_410686 [Cucurbitaria berberidis CBS 394.84]